MVGVRTADTTDVPAIQRVARESWQAAYDEVLPSDVVETVLGEWYDEEFLERSVTAAEVV